MCALSELKRYDVRTYMFPRQKKSRAKNSRNPALWTSFMCAALYGCPRRFRLRFWRRPSDGSILLSTSIVELSGHAIIICFFFFFTISCLSTRCREGRNKANTKSTIVGQTFLRIFYLDTFLLCCPLDFAIFALVCAINPTSRWTYVTKPTRRGEVETRYANSRS